MINHKDSKSTSSEISEKQHLDYLGLALEEAKKCTPVPTAFCVGCVIVVHPDKIASEQDAESKVEEDTLVGKDQQIDGGQGGESASSGIVISTGYSRELPGNTHAEANALHKAKHLPPPPTLSKTSISTSGNNNKDYIKTDYLTSYPVEPTLPISALLRTADVYTTLEPCSVRTSGLAPCSKALIDAGIKRCFIGAPEPPDFVQCEGAKELVDAGIEVVWLKGLEEQCLKVARNEISQ